MLLVNKAVMLVWALPISVTLIQLAFCSVFCCLIPWTIRSSWHDAWRWARACRALVMLAASMLALHYSTTGAVVVTRNIAPH